MSQQGPIDVRPGERLPAAVLALHAAALGFAYVCLEAAANAVFLDRFPASALPWVYFASGATTIALGWVFTRLAARRPIERLAPAMVAVLGVSLLVLYAALKTWRAAAMAVMVWKDVFYILAGLEVWGMAGALFDIRQSKRIFPLIGAGEVLAVAVGGFAVPALLRHIPVEGLLLASAAGTAGGLLLTWTAVPLLRAARAAREEPDDDAEPAPLRELARRPYVALFFAASILSYLAYYLIDYLYFGRLTTLFPQKEDIAAFTGVFSAVLGTTNLLFGLTVSPRVLDRFGVRSAILVLPAAAALSALAGLGALKAAGLGTAVAAVLIAAKFMDELLRRAVEGTVNRILYQPLPPRERLVTQAARESLVEPAAIALSAALLALLAQRFGPAVFLACLLAVAAAWLCCVSGVGRGYVRLLSEAVSRRRLDGRGLIVASDDVLADVEAALSSSEAQALYAVEFLGRARPDRLRARAPELLAASSQPLREAALSWLDAGQERLIRPHAAADRPASERAAALRALGEAASADVERLAAGGDVERWIAARAACGEAAARLLPQLLVDAHAPVRRAAFARATELAEPAFVPHAAAALREPAVAGLAAGALVAIGDPALDALMRALEEPKQPAVRRRAAYALGRVGSARAIEALARSLETARPILRGHLLGALASAGNRAPEGALRSCLRRELAEAAWALAALGDLDGEPRWAPLKLALRDELERGRRRIASALACLARQPSLARADLSGRGNAEARARAVEAISNASPFRLRAPIVALFEDLPEAGRRERLHQAFPQRRLDAPARAAEAAARMEATGWLRACAVFSSDAAGPGRPVIEKALSDPDPLTRDTARRKLENGGAPMMSTLEKTLALKTVDLLSSLPNEHLADVAARASQVERKAGEVLFRRGDSGRSMVVIVKGSVRVEAGGRELARLGPGEVVGELAALDPEVRAADVTAAEDALLLSIDQETLAAVVHEHPEAAQGVIAVLCRRLRGTIPPAGA